MQFSKLLVQAGLSEKEARVYLATLELGATAVQPIARLAKVARATSYSMLEQLQAKGLVTGLQTGNKIKYLAESPEHLLNQVKNKVGNMREAEQTLSAALPQLLALVKSDKGKPVVRFFEGVEGLTTMRREMIMYCRSHQDIWYNFTPIDNLFALFPPEESDEFAKIRVAKRVAAKTIFTTKSTELKKKLLATSKQELNDRKYVSPQRFSSTSGLTIYRDRVAIGTFVGHLGGVIMESQSIASMMRDSFNIMWDSL